MNQFAILTHPPLLHAIAVHFPIALAILGIPLVYLCAVVASERDVLRWVTTATYGVVALSAYSAQLAGERARDGLSNTLPQEVWDVVNWHEELGEKIWMLAAVTMLLMALSVVKVRWFRITMMTLAMIMSLVTGGWVAVTGHYGGSLVYVYGVGMGTEQPAGLAPATESTRHRDDDADDDEGEEHGEPRGPALAPGEAGPGLPVRPLDPTEAAAVSYVRDIKPLLEQRCLPCHGPEKARGELVVTTLDALRKGGEDEGPGVVPGDPDASSIVKYIRGELQPRMPKGKDPLTPDEIHRIRLWISAGAVDDSQATPAPPAAPTPEATPEVPAPPPPVAPTPVSPPPTAPSAPSSTNGGGSPVLTTVLPASRTVF